MSAPLTPLVVIQWIITNDTWLEKSNNSTFCSSKGQVIDKLQEAFDALLKDNVKTGHVRLCQCVIEAMIEAESGFFENLVARG